MRCLDGSGEHLKRTCVCVYLLLTEDQQALWFDWMIWSQILSTPPLDAILESFPNTITSGPGYADVMPLSIIDEKGQFSNLEENRRYDVRVCCIEPKKLTL